MGSGRYCNARAPRRPFPGRPRPLFAAENKVATPSGPRSPANLGVPAVSDVPSEEPHPVLAHDGIPAIELTIWRSRWPGCSPRRSSSCGGRGTIPFGGKRSCDPADPRGIALMHRLGKPARSLLGDISIVRTAARERPRGAVTLGGAELALPMQSRDLAHRRVRPASGETDHAELVMAAVACGGCAGGSARLRPRVAPSIRHAPFTLVVPDRMGDRASGHQTDRSAVARWVWQEVK